MDLHALAVDLATAVAAFGVLFVIYRPLERAYPAWREQAFFRPGWGTDLCFFLGHYLIWIAIVVDVLYDFTPWLHAVMPRGVRRVVAEQPFWLQFVGIVALGDVCIYWAHRLQHKVDFLWRFHAVHHSSEHLDWLAAHREHPLDTIYSATIMNLPAYMLGFSGAALVSFVTFRGLMSILIHSNVRVNLGWFGLVFGSPAFHHWHHARDRASCNFANVSPLMDVLFGTHHEPGHEPESLGLSEPVARGYVGLLVNPLLPARFHVGTLKPNQGG